MPVNRNLPRHWQDWGSLALGAWLFASPWLLHYAALRPAAENAWIVGAVIVTIGVLSRVAFHLVEEFIDLLLGLWVLVSPWALLYTGATVPAADAVIVGALILLLALWEIRDSQIGGARAA